MTRELSFEQTVPRALVHRTALSEVYVADSVQTGDREFALAIQIPRAHCVWFDRRVAYHDPLSTAEAARQGVYVVVHRYIAVPMGQVFTLQRLGLRVQALDRYHDHGAPLHGVLRLRLTERSEPSSAQGTMSFEGDIVINGDVAMTLSGDLVFLSRDDYVALRAYQRRRAPAPFPPPVDGPALEPFETGRLDQRNSVLAEPVIEGPFASSYPLVVDEHHPSFFDHDYDHAPGPLIVEAYRQAAIVTAHRAGALPSPVVAITSCDATFTDFAELDARIDCSASIDERFDDGRVRVKVALLQFGREVSSGDVELSPYPDG
jgi:hypothetical protein